ncbi:maker496 [Drosophila busckii]|uniref:Maker496 n=1 Tax=Drosophila busckii TaxID=30019 RepID=A0A0M4ERK5_DROBS|nr:maker496 [Drosophila busckii]
MYAQAQLKEAFDKDEYQKFNEALELGASANLCCYEDVSGNMTSIYELALITEDSAHYIKACLNHGCDVNYVSGKKASFIFRVSLEMLAKSLTSSNAGNTIKLFKELIDYDASLEAKDDQEKTAFEYVLENEELGPQQRATILQTFIENQTLSTENHHLALKFICDAKIETNYMTLVRALLGLNEKELSHQLQDFQRRISDWKLYRIQIALLQTYRKEQLESALDALLLTVPWSQKEDYIKVMEAAIFADCWKVVWQVGKCCRKNSTVSGEDRIQLLNALIQRSPRCEDREEYEGSLDLLLGHNYCCIDDPIDEQHNTSLHLAVQQDNELAVRLLLDRGASLTCSNKQKQFPLANMPVDLLQQHFDDCLDSSGKHGTEDFELTLQYKNFCTADESSALVPILYMARCKELQKLLHHPLIGSLLQIKWQRLRSLFYIHFIISLVYSVALMAQVLLRFPNRNESALFDGFLWIYGFELICWAIMVYNLLNMISSYFLSRHRPHWLEAALIFITFLNSDFLKFSHDWQLFIAVVAIMLMALNLIRQIGGIPIRIIATHVHMLSLVARNFLTSFAHHSVLLGTFGLIFYILFGKTETSPDEKFLTHTKPSSTFLKTFIMFWGQYDESDFINVYSTLVVLSFMLLAMILSNLLSGLAKNLQELLEAKGEIQNNLKEIKKCIDLKS